MNMLKGKKQGPSITSCINRFLKEPVQDRKRKRDRDVVMGLFNDYLAGYGEVESNVERDPLIVTAPLSDLRPGHFRLFLTWFVIRKVMDRNKSQYAPVLREFADWLTRPAQPRDGRPDRPIPRRRCLRRRHHDRGQGAWLLLR